MSLAYHFARQYFDYCANLSNARMPVQMTTLQFEGLLSTLKEACAASGVEVKDVLTTVAHSISEREPGKADRLRKLFMSLKDEPVH